MRRVCIGLSAVLFVLIVSVPAFAALEVIGTATYQGADYNLIWDDDNNGNSVIWFDYTHAQERWSDQNAWVVGLDDQLTIIWKPGINVTWTDATWRLPVTVGGEFVYGCDGMTNGGYNITSSEMGHLYYTELGNPGFRDGASCEYNPDYGLHNTGDFQNLVAAAWYWSSTEYAPHPYRAWYFSLNTGYQSYANKRSTFYGLALRSGQVVEGTIPTLSEWGQILLVVMLGVSALWMIRKRRMIV